MSEQLWLLRLQKFKYFIIVETQPAYEEDESVENNFLDGGKKTKYLQTK
jgi:hypothetical protein